MKKEVIIPLLIILFSTATIATSYDADTSVIKAYLESISPYPVEPGQDFTIQIRVYNEGGELAQGVKIGIEFDKYFFLKSKEDDFDKPLNLCAGCSKDNMYYFIVMPDTLSGEYPITVRIDRGGAITEKKVFVKVIGQPDIIFDTKLLDDQISSDDSFNVLLNIRNVGTGIARNIKLEPVTSGFVMSESNLVFINELKPNEELNKTIHIMTSDSLSQEPHKITFKLSYKDEKSNQITLNQALGIKLLDKTKLDIASVVIEPQPIIKGKKTIITVRVENLGEGQAENIKVLLKSDGFEGQTKAYIGKLDEDEDAPTVFTLIPSDAGNHELEIKVTYEDDVGKHEIIESLDVLILRDIKLWAGIIITIGILMFLFLSGVGLFGYKIWETGKYEVWKKKLEEFWRKM